MVYVPRTLFIVFSLPCVIRACYYFLCDLRLFYSYLTFLTWIIPYAFMLSETIEAGLLVLVTQCVTGSLQHSLRLPHHVLQL